MRTEPDSDAESKLAPAARLAPMKPRSSEIRVALRRFVPSVIMAAAKLATPGRAGGS